MSKLFLTAAATATFVAGLALPATPALTQRSSEIIVYGTDPCPRSTDDAIVVCVRKGERERFRIPEKLREGGSLQQRQAWANKAGEIAGYGATGAQSCSPVGPGGHTGCLRQEINKAYAEKDEDKASSTAP